LVGLHGHSSRNELAHWETAANLSAAGGTDRAFIHADATTVVNYTTSAVALADLFTLPDEYDAPAVPLLKCRAFSHRGRIR
jgi:hypothetical protein